MDHYVGVSTNRRGEMGVDASGQPVVEKFGILDGSTAEIDGLHHATRRQNSQHCVEVGLTGKIRGFKGIGERFAVFCRKGQIL